MKKFIFNFKTKTGSDRKITIGKNSISKSIQSGTIMKSKAGFFVFIFFLVHMLMFGGSGFALAYATDSPYLFALMHGGIAILVYIIFYLVIFGIDAIKWMVINSIFGILQTHEIINLIGTTFINNYNFFSYPFYRHIIPATYIILYMFLIRQFINYILKSHKNKNREKYANWFFIVINLIFILLLGDTTNLFLSL